MLMALVFALLMSGQRKISSIVAIKSVAWPLAFFFDCHLRLIAPLFNLDTVLPFVLAMNIAFCSYSSSNFTTSNE